MAYKQRERELAEACDIAAARWHGFIQAEIGERLNWSSRPAVQAGFNVGYMEGCNLLINEGRRDEHWMGTAKAITRAHVESAKARHIEHVVRQADKIADLEQE